MARADDRIGGERTEAEVHPAGARRPPLDVLVCPDKFRGSVTAPEAAEALAAGIGSVAGARARTVPIADGGEGTVDCCLAAGFSEHRVRVTGATGETLQARFATRDGVAVIEAAQACGLADREPSTRGALSATTYGVGELIGAALELGCRSLVVGVGGTASTDGGAGMLQALGARLSDRVGTTISHGGGGLGALATVELASVEDRLGTCDLVVATDVDNPLLGARGAAAAFGPQKGADRLTIEVLQQGLERWTRLCGSAPASAPGSGAGGGIGYGLMLVGARRVSGAEAVLDLLGVDRLARESSLIITGEGSVDATSLGGKAPIAVARRANRLGVPVIAVAGRSTLTTAQCREAGIEEVHELLELAGCSERSIREARSLLRQIGERIAARWCDRGGTQMAIGSRGA